MWREKDLATYYHGSSELGRQTNTSVLPPPPPPLLSCSCHPPFSLPRGHPTRPNPHPGFLSLGNIPQIGREIGIVDGIHPHPRPYRYVGYLSSVLVFFYLFFFLHAHKKEDGWVGLIIILIIFF